MTIRCVHAPIRFIISSMLGMQFPSTYYEYTLGDLSHGLRARRPMKKPSRDRSNKKDAKMRVKDLKRHCAPYQIYARRKTTINHAFAAAIAPCDSFAEATVKEAMRALGQDPERDLSCVYCDATAETWDHVFATVKNSVFSGIGHRLGNLVPCCKPCNSRKGNKKGNKAWEKFILDREAPGPARDSRVDRMKTYLQRYSASDSVPDGLIEYARFMEIRDQILHLMREADEIAVLIRRRMEKSQ
jgi:5-methylcytosine-specific restriction endonuclease McrA